MGRSILASALALFLVVAAIAAMPEHHAHAFPEPEPQPHAVSDGHPVSDPLPHSDTVPIAHRQPERDADSLCRRAAREPSTRSRTTSRPSFPAIIARPGPSEQEQPESTPSGARSPASPKERTGVPGHGRYGLPGRVEPDEHADSAPVDRGGELDAADRSGPRLPGQRQVDLNHICVRGLGDLGRQSHQDRLVPLPGSLANSSGPRVTVCGRRSPRPVDR